MVSDLTGKVTNQFSLIVEALSSLFRELSLDRYYLWVFFFIYIFLPTNNAANMSKVCALNPIFKNIENCYNTLFIVVTVYR